MLNRLPLFLGEPIVFGGIKLYSPRLSEISAIGEMEYLINFQLTTFDKEKILLDLFQIEQDRFDSIADENDFAVLTDHPSIREHICKSLSFFVKDDVYFDVKTESFMVGEIPFININNFVEFQTCIREVNGSSGIEEKEKKMSAKAKKFQERINSFKKKAKKKDDEIELKDIASILCSADGNGINVFNVGQLTIYQAHEQFAQVNVKEEHKRLLPVWANGHLSEGTKLPEWIKRTKF